MKDLLVDIFDHLKELSTIQKRCIGFVVAANFMNLLAYPMIRSSTDSLFIHLHGAEKSPLVWLYAVITLAIVLFIFNHFQNKLHVQRLFLGISALSAFFFFGGGVFGKDGPSWMAYPLFIWKEAYIVLLIHMAMGLLNTIVNKDIAKVLYGPVGALNSLAGVLGGVIGSYLVTLIQTNGLMILSALLIGVSGFLILGTIAWETRLRVDERQTIFSSVKVQKTYVLLIMVIVLLSQFLTNMANFQFNLSLGELNLSLDKKTQYFTWIYASINGASFLLQLLIPVMLRFIHTGTLLSSVPFIGGGIWLLCQVFPDNLGIILFALPFITFKALDYSWFSTGKEFLYFHLSPVQRYGAKYLSDILTYRFSKGLISFILVFIQAGLHVRLMMLGVLLLWPVCNFILLRNRPKLVDSEKA